jgi:hypothetical protein
VDLALVDPKRKQAIICDVFEFFRVDYLGELKTAQDQLQNTSLPLSVDNIYTEIQQRMIEPLLVSSLMANDTFMRDWLLGGEKDEATVVRYLNEIQKKYGVFTTFLVSEATKNYYHPKGLIDVVNASNSADAWYFITPLKNKLKNQLAYRTFGCLKKLATF